jgi:hypothetical protein
VFAYVTGFQGNTQLGIGNTGFTSGELITGFISGSTTTINSILTNHASNLAAFIITGNCSWVGRNVSISNEGLTFQSNATNAYPL